ncbi:hypothetical protein TNCV_427841 [Trichonephila clavipes]|nr:hypothetical protein TNCV_427841 [Trichonephila clavipes]
MSLIKKSTKNVPNPPNYSFNTIWSFKAHKRLPEGKQHDIFGALSDDCKAVFKHGNPDRAQWVDEYLQSGDIQRLELPAIDVP